MVLVVVVASVVVVVVSVFQAVRDRFDRQMRTGIVASLLALRERGRAVEHEDGALRPLLVEVRGEAFSHAVVLEPHSVDVGEGLFVLRSVLVPHERIPRCKGAWQMLHLDPKSAAMRCQAVEENEQRLSDLIGVGQIVHEDVVWLAGGDEWSGRTHT